MVSTQFILGRIKYSFNSNVNSISSPMFSHGVVNSPHFNNNNFNNVKINNQINPNTINNSSTHTNINTHNNNNPNNNFNEQIAQIANYCSDIISKNPTSALLVAAAIHLVMDKLCKPIFVDLIKENGINDENFHEDRKKSGIGIDWIL